MFFGLIGLCNLTGWVLKAWLLLLHVFFGLIILGKLSGIRQRVTRIAGVVASVCVNANANLLGFWFWMVIQRLVDSCFCWYWIIPGLVALLFNPHGHVIVLPLKWLLYSSVNSSMPSRLCYFELNPKLGAYLLC